MEKDRVIGDCCPITIAHLAMTWKVIVAGVVVTASVDLFVAAQSDVRGTLVTEDSVPLVSTMPTWTEEWERRCPAKTNVRLKR